MEVVGYVAVAVLVVVAALLLGRELEHHVQTLDAWIAGLGSWSLVAFIVVLALGTSLLLPESLFSVAAGVLFGPAWGFAASFAGNLLAASLQYVLARRLLRSRIQKTLAARPPLAALRRAVLQEGLRLQLLVRLTPLNPASISYLLGAAGVGFRDFLVSCLGLLPHIALEVFLGHAGKHVVGIAGGVRGTVAYYAEIFGGLVAVIVLVLVVSRIAHRALTRAVAREVDS